MIRSVLRKRGDEYVVVISEEEVIAHDLHDGDAVDVQPTTPDARTGLRPEVQRAWEESWERNEEGYRYLADR